MFAQVIAGMDTVDKIAKTKVDENYKPAENIVIENIEIKEYSSADTTTATVSKTQLSQQHNQMQTLSNRSIL